MKRAIMLMCCAIIFSGCSLIPMQPYIQTYYFDIGSPEASLGTPQKDLTIMNIARSGPYREKMVFRTSQTSVRFDEFNRWSMPPTEMIKRYLTMIYETNNEVGSEKGKKYSLNGELTQLEADLPNKKVNLTIRFELNQSDSNKNVWLKSFSQQIPVQKVTGQSFAKAVKFGVDNIIKELDMHLESSIK